MSSCRVIILCSCVALTITSIQHVSRKTAQAPWTSCNGFVGFPSILTCYSFCIKVFDNLYLFSRDDITKTCYCCDQVPGLSDQYLSISEKLSFKTGFCPFKYTGYKYNQDKVCLRYEESLKTYDESVDVCQREGGDLIRVDSLHKHNIMKEFVEKKRSISEVQVWVQGIRDSNLIWRYHDSTELNYTCLTQITANADSNYMRAVSADDYNCNDHTHLYKTFYLCEIYIRDIWF